MSERRFFLIYLILLLVIPQVQHLEKIIQGVPKKCPFFGQSDWRRHIFFGTSCVSKISKLRTVVHPLVSSQIKMRWDSYLVWHPHWTVVSCLINISRKLFYSLYVNKSLCLNTRNYSLWPQIGFTYGSSQAGGSHVTWLLVRNCRLQLGRRGRGQQNGKFL